VIKTTADGNDDRTNLIYDQMQWWKSFETFPLVLCSAVEIFVIFLSSSFNHCLCSASLPLSSFPPSSPPLSFLTIISVSSQFEFDLAAAIATACHLKPALVNPSL
jgi:hypothetical protein